MTHAFWFLIFSTTSISFTPVTPPWNLCFEMGVTDAWVAHGPVEYLPGDAYLEGILLHGKCGDQELFLNAHFEQDKAISPSFRRCDAIKLRFIGPNKIAVKKENESEFSLTIVSGMLTRAPKEEIVIPEFLKPVVQSQSHCH